MAFTHASGSASRIQVRMPSRNSDCSGVSSIFQRTTAPCCQARSAPRLSGRLRRHTTKLDRAVKYPSRVPDELTEEEQERRRRAIPEIMPAAPFMGWLGLVFERYEHDDVTLR